MTTAFIIELGKYIQSNDNFIETLVDKHNLLKAEYELKLAEKKQNVIDTIIYLEKNDNEVQLDYNTYLEKVKEAKININYI
jgi:hypothetical protein